MEAYVEPHLTWRFLGPEDAEEVDEFRQQLDALDNSVLSGVASAITDSHLFVGEGMAVGGWDAYRSLSAFGVSYIADTDPLRIYLMGGVHPVHRHQSIGTALFRWQVEGAIEWRDENRPGQPLWLGCYAELGRPGTERVASHFGFTTERFYFDLQRDLTHPVKRHEVPGLTFQELTDDRAEEVRVLHNLCFAALGGSDVEPAAWEHRLEEGSFRKDWSYLALDGDRVVGYAMSGEDEEFDDDQPVGWTERFGVHPDYRGRGVSLALLSHCLTAMRASGCLEAGIGVDTVDGLGIKRFAAELGYATRDAVALLSRVVD
ncbi:MAG: GNAT family N-acetyltransferase [Propionibacteriaceae bacterium]|nr:GNAT family N-acetyltransferase [Propionibacteriaceae bacterium]